VRISLIVAAADGDVIGRDGELPWRLPADLRRFRELTTGHVVVAGRRTHESIMDRLGGPLPGRITVVVSRTILAGSGPVFYQPSVAAALSVARAIEEFAGGDEVFVIGGAEVYGASLSEVDRIELTRVDTEVAGDARMPEGWLAGFALVDAQPGVEGGLKYEFQRWERA
jgi:dihydrofolate reductase